MMIKLNNRQTMVVAVAVALVLFLSATLVYLLLRNDEGLVEVPGVPQELWSRKLQTTAHEDVATITNEYDGYSIEVPKDWSVPKTASGGGGLSIAYSPEGTFHEDIDFAYGLQLTVYVDRLPQGTSLEEWINDHFGPSQLQNATVATYAAKKSSQPLIEHNTLLQEVPRDNSLVERFFINENGKVFALMCAAEGSQYEELVALCVAQLESFTILR